MHRGYLALWRKVKDHPFYQEPREFSKYEAWIDLLMEAQHEEGAKRVIIGMNVLECHYGESLKSVTTWADRWKWSRSKVFRFLKLLKKMGQIDYTSETVTTRIKIVNYECYDPKRNGDRTETECDRTASETQAVTDNNDKNVKNTDNTLTGICDDKSPRCPQKEIIDLYNTILPELPRCKVFSEQYGKMLKTRWREDGNRQCLEWWENFFKMEIRTSDFLMGKVNDFTADLTWIVRPKNFTKIVNGNYRNKKPINNQTTPDYY